MKLTNIERETIILFNEHEKTAEIYTHNAKLITRIKKMCEEHPNEYTTTNENQHGAITCILPKKRLAITLRAPTNPEVSKKTSERLKQLKPWEDSPIYQKRAIKKKMSAD